MSVPDAGLLPSTPRAGRVHERVDDVVREAVRVRRKRLRRDDAHVLPVAGRRVLSLRALEETAGDGRRARLRRAALELLDVAEAERLQARKVEPADRARDVAERVGSLIAVLVGVRQLAGTDGIKHDYASSGHRAILGTAVSDRLRTRRSSPSTASRSWAPPPGSRGSSCGTRRARSPSSRRLDPRAAAGRPRAACTRGREPRRRLRT